MPISISHFKIKVRDLPGMEALLIRTPWASGSLTAALRTVPVAAIGWYFFRKTPANTTRSFSMKLKTAIFHRGHWIIQPSASMTRKSFEAFMTPSRPTAALTMRRFPMAPPGPSISAIRKATAWNSLSIPPGMLLSRYAFLSIFRCRMRT